MTEPGREEPDGRPESAGSLNVEQTGQQTVANVMLESWPGHPGVPPLNTACTSVGSGGPELDAEVGWRRDDAVWGDSSQPVAAYFLVSSQIMHDIHECLNTSDTHRTALWKI